MTRIRARRGLAMFGAAWLVTSLAVAAPQNDVPTHGKPPATRPKSKAAAHEVVPEVDDQAPKTDPPGLDLSPSVLKSAVGAADEDYARSASPMAFGTNPSSAQAKIDRSFEAAQIEGCGSNALKFDAVPVWGDFVMGVFALPYALHAMATGRCKMWPK